MILKNSKGKRMKCDMSPGAIDTRLKRVSELRRMCLALNKSRFLAKKNIPNAVGAQKYTGDDNKSEVNEK